ncbi:MAG: hypothetical protein IJM41_02135 [Bacteroidales bacterium]|nr:hypothetical protein [Bacteroidales bacterium]
MNKKLTYEQPSCDLFVIKVEENFLQSGNYGAKGAAGGDIVEGNEYDL